MNVSAKLAISVAVFAVMLGTLSVQPLAALPEYTEKERKECDFCHPAGDLFALNEAGRFYAEHNHSLEGYETPEAKPPAPAEPKPVPTNPKPVEPAKPH